MVNQGKRQTQIPEFVRNERTRMIESHTPPVRQIESKESQAPESVVRAAPEHINKLLEELYQSMGTGRRA